MGKSNKVAENAQPFILIDIKNKTDKTRPSKSKSNKEERIRTSL